MKKSITAKARKSPTKARKSPVKARKSAAKARKSPTKARKSPAKARKSPVKARKSAAKKSVKVKKYRMDSNSNEPLAYDPNDGDIRNIDVDYGRDRFQSAFFTREPRGRKGQKYRGGKLPENIAAIKAVRDYIKYGGKMPSQKMAISAINYLATRFLDEDYKLTDEQHERFEEMRDLGD